MYSFEFKGSVKTKELSESDVIFFLNHLLFLTLRNIWNLSLVLLYLSYHPAVFELYCWLTIFSVLCTCNLAFQKHQTPIILYFKVVYRIGTPPDLSVYAYLFPPASVHYVEFVYELSLSLPASYWWGWGGRRVNWISAAVFLNIPFVDNFSVIYKFFVYWLLIIILLSCRS